MASRSTSQHGATGGKRTSASRSGARSSSTRSRSTAPRTAAARSAAPKTTSRPRPATGKSRSGATRKKSGTSLGNTFYRLLPVLVAAALAFSAWTFYPTLKLRYAQQRENDQLQSELLGLQQRNGELRKQVERLKTPEGVEDAARESLGLVRPGENQYVVTGAEDASSSVKANDRPADPQRRDDGLWVRVLDLVFGFREGGGR